MDHAAIIELRLRNHGLRAPGSGEPHDLVARFAAMQSQEFAYAKWSIAQRLAGCSKVDVDRALAAGGILRTHVLRPTWHFVAARDIRWLTALSGPRVHALNRYYYRKYGLDRTLLTKAARAMTKALSAGHLTRDELRLRLYGAGIEVEGPRLAYVVMYAELEGLICSGIMRGKQQTYALIEERAPAAPALSRDEALGELTRRYFETRGPATLRDFTGWSSLSVADGRRGLEIAGKRLERVVAGDRSYWLSSDRGPALPKKPVVDLLQAYDEYGMSYSESRDVMRDPALEISDGPAPLHLLLLDGRLIGRWRHAQRQGGVGVETSLYRLLKAGEERALKGAIKRYEAFRAVSGAPAA